MMILRFLSSLFRRKILPIILILYFCSFNATGVFALGRPFELKPVVVTATRTEQKLDQTTANIELLTREDIESIPARNVAEALEYVPGVFIDFNGGLGAQATASVQGSLSRQVTVFLDGVRLNMQANPIVDLSFIPTSNLDRIEIYKGAASSVWGSGLGGVINIITRDPTGDDFHLSTELSAGKDDTFGYKTVIDGKRFSLGSIFVAEHLETGGHIEHSSHRMDDLYTKLKYAITGTSDLTFSLGYNQGRAENPLPNLPSFFDESHKRRFFQTLKFNASPLDNFIVEAGLWNQRFTNRQERIFPGTRQTENNFELIERLFGANIKMVWETAQYNTLVAGADGEWGGYEYTEIGPDTLSSRNLAVYVNDVFTHGCWTINAGVRLDDNKDFGTEINPSLGAAYRFEKSGLTLKFQVARAFSAPPLSYLFYPETGNPDLRPESGVNVQFGGEWKQSDFLTLKANVFWAQIDDLIRFDPVKNQLVNEDSVVRRGIEAQAVAFLPFGFKLLGGMTWVDVENDKTGKKVKDMPGIIWDFSAAHRINDIFFHSLSGNYIWYNSSLEETRDKKFVFDYMARASLPRQIAGCTISLYGAVHNLFNSTRFLLSGFPNPDRWFEAGLRFEY